jgi:hypothetical protein
LGVRQGISINRLFVASDNGREVSSRSLAKLNPNQFGPVFQRRRFKNRYRIVVRIPIADAESVLAMMGTGRVTS